MARIRVHIIYENDLRIFLRILFWKTNIYPDGNIKLDPEKYDQMLSELKKEAELSQTIINEFKHETKNYGLLEDLKLIVKLLAYVLKTFAPHLHVKVAKLHINVATADAAKTAILYGAVSGTVACLIDTIEDYTNLDRLKKSSVIVQPDFLSDSSSARIRISLSISVYGFLRTMFKLAMKYTIIKNKNSVKNTPKGK